MLVLTCFIFFWSITLLLQNNPLQGEKENVFLRVSYLITKIEYLLCLELNFSIKIFTLHDRKLVNIKEMKRENINGYRQILLLVVWLTFWKWNKEKQKIWFFDSFHVCSFSLILNIKKLESMKWIDNWYLIISNQLSI